MEKKNLLECSDKIIKGRISRSIKRWSTINPFDNGEFTQYDFLINYSCLFTKQIKQYKVSIFLGREKQFKAFKQALQEFKSKYFNHIKKLQKEKK